MMRRIVVIVAIAILIAVLVLWFARRSIADTAIADALKKAGVTAQYRVTDIGLRWQRIEAIRLGDPKMPDLTADWAEVRLEADWNGVRATAIRAGGVRLRGRLVDGKLSWGALDRLLPKPTGTPFALPALAVDVRDARIGVTTPWGPIGVRVDGQGRLDDGFTGKLAMIAPTLVAGSCRAMRTTAYVDLSIRRGAPSVRGPVRTASANCGGVTLAASSLAVDAALTRAFDGWRGTAKLDLGRMTAQSGDLAGITGTIAFSGNGKSNTGTARLVAASGAIGKTQIAGLALDGSFGLRGNDADMQSHLHAARVSPDASVLQAARGALAQLADTPLGALSAQLATAVTGAARGAAVDADIVAINRQAGASATITRLTAQTRSGAWLRMGERAGLRFGALGLIADAKLSLSGGGFPHVEADFKRVATGETRGIARMLPYTAGGARLVLTPAAFVLRGDGGARLATVATLDGPFRDGSVMGLRTPIVVAIDPRGGIVANPGCTPIAFTQLRFATLRLNATALRLCPTQTALMRVAGGRLSGGATIAAPRLSGALGSAPFAVTATSARIGLADTQFALSNMSARIGSADRISQLDIGTLTGRLQGSLLSGRFGGLDGRIGAVPLAIGAGAGPWSFARGILTAGGTAMVSDTNPSARFRTMQMDAVRMTLAQGHVALTGTLREPVSRATVAQVDLRHDLASGVGDAVLDVGGIAFGKDLQPDAITPLTIGVIANVQGRVAGRGAIAWNADGVTSSGRFGTQNMDFAAAFGPVTGVTGDIVFTDLLGLVTAPGQTATIASVNPGIAVLGGNVRYHLAAGQKIIVEDGRWPFAGGLLILDPTVLDMGESRERRLTFRVDALDAAKFIETLQFENLAATGIFDGTIPMIFDAQGGRIAGGRITARAGGGTLAYVGEVSNAAMNVYAKLAFDALKSLRYQNLTIALQGPLDGEMVSTIDFRGVNQNPVVQPKNFIVRKFIGLPFKFNIVIRAPFRSLLYTARTFQDPSLLIRGLPLPPPVQPPASGNSP